MLYITISQRAVAASLSPGYGLIIAGSGELANTRELPPFDASPVHTCLPPLPPTADKPSEDLAVQFGISSMTLGIDDSDHCEGTPGRETGSTPTILNEVEIHLRENLLGLCHSLFPASTEQLVMFTRGRFRLKTAAKVTIEVEIQGNSRSFHPFGLARMGGHEFCAFVPS